MKKKLTKKTWKNIGLGCLAGVLGIGAVMGVGALLNREEDLTKTINPTYAIGGLTEEGRYLETEGSIYTKDAFECQGLDVTLDFDSNVSYRIFFYDEDNDFISATEKQTNNYDETTTPVLAKYARIVITPNDDEKISIFEKNGYAKQLEIEVFKNQDNSLPDYDFDMSKLVGCGRTINNENAFLVSENYFGGLIDLSDFKSYSKVRFTNNSLDTAVTYTFLTADISTATADDEIPFVNSYSSTIKNEVDNVFEVEIPDDAKYLYVYMQSGGETVISYTPDLITFTN